MKAVSRVTNRKYTEKIRTWVRILFKPRGGEIILFIVLFLTMLFLTEQIGGIPIAKEEVGGMYRVTIKGPGPNRMISHELYWSWIIFSYVIFSPYFIFFAVKYFPYLDGTRK